MSGDSYSLDKLREVFGETGLAGVTRRGLRVATGGLQGVLGRVESTLLEREFEARIQHLAPLLDRNRRFKGVHQNQRAFVIGNGPSLAQVDLGFMADEITFCVNAFWKHPIVEKHSPSYYLVTDGRLFDDTDASLKFIEDLAQRVPAADFFIPLEARSYVLERGLLPSNSTHFLALNGYLPDYSHVSVDLTRVVPSPPTVIQTAVFVALYMGFKEVVLLGCDHNWLDDYGHDAHFYADQTADHIDGSEGRDDYLHMMNFVRNVWRGYRRLRSLAEVAGVDVINATVGGRLDVFRRQPLADLLG